MREPDGSPGQWYLHLFAPEQPDLDWDHPGVREEFDAILRFWFDRGVDGIRVDAAPAMAKVPGLPDAGHGPGALFESRTWVGNPHWDVDEVHDILRRWRAIGDSYDGRPAVRRRGRRQRARAAQPLRAARTRCTPASTSTT